MDYRYYDKVQRPPLFPFGHGLSYTTFNLSNLRIAVHDSTLCASLSITNTGSRPGAEVIQLYVSALTPSIGRPVKELKGFKKVFLQQGEEKEVRIDVETKLATSFWDEERNAWIVEKGEYRVLVGNSSGCEEFLQAEFRIEETYWWDGL